MAESNKTNGDDKVPYHKLTVVPNVEQLILDELAKGRSLLSIANDLGVTDSAVLARVQHLPDYKSKARIGLKLRMDKREGELEKSVTNVDVTRADRLLGHSRWLNERLNQDEFGAKQTISGDQDNPLIAIDKDSLLIETARAMAYIIAAAQVIHNSDVDASHQTIEGERIMPSDSDNTQDNQ